MMRIISGSARGTKLKTLEGMNTRPTLERVKEALFSMIQFDVSGSVVLDLFAGSGQLSLEALSRGAYFADLADKSPEAAKIIKDNINKTHFEAKTNLFVGDSLRFLSFTKRKYSLVFLDPPYAGELLFSALSLIKENNLLEDGAVIVCEISSDDSESEEKLISFCDDDFSLRKNKAYSGARIMVFDYKKNNESENVDG